MAAPKENSFWKLRQEHGRTKRFETPEELWKEACGYFEWIDKNPLIEEKFFGTGLVQYPKKKRPYTMQGLCFFLSIGERTWNDYKNKYEDFSPVVERIEQVMFTQKFEGAAAGFFNPNIIARDLGLVEKTESKQEINNNADRDYSKLSAEELKQLLELEKKASGK